MKKKKQQLFPRSALKSLEKDIIRLISSNEGRLFVLEIIEEIPYDIRPYVIEGLSAFHEKEMTDFFHLIKLEYEKELDYLCTRALDKYKMSGMDISPPQIFDGSFVKAYASYSRHTGRITVDIAWNTGGKGVHVECFYLTYCPDGIHSFFLVEDMPLSQYEEDRKILSDMLEISFEEACFLISQAYAFNIRHMSRPALGKFLYQKYLDKKIELPREEEKQLIRRLSMRLPPRQLVNNFFYALKHKDLSYIFSLLSSKDFSSAGLLKQISDMLSPGLAILEGQVEEVYGSKNTAKVTAYSISIENREVYRNEYHFYLLNEAAVGWSISEIEKVKKDLIDAKSESNPFNTQVFCRVYELVDVDELFSVLDKVDNIKEIEELPYGLHMRVSYLSDDFNQGISVFGGVVADLVLNGDEFVIISSQHSSIIDFHNLLTCEPNIPVICRGEYQVSLITAYSYLGGQYINFEDLLLQEENRDFSFEDGMCFISARYMVKDMEQVLERIEKLKTIRIELPGQCKVFYQLKDDLDEPGFFAEYMLGSNWVTVSTFGEHDMHLARQKFEEKMFGSLEFDGIELREEGIFDILSSEVKKEYPQLETILKEMYLNKWYYSRLTTLSGMSPSEASQSEEGSRMLWAMFKRLKQREKKEYSIPGKKQNINLREYIRKVEQKKGGKH